MEGGRKRSATARWIALGAFVCFVAYAAGWNYAFTKQVNNTIKLNAYSEEVARLRDNAGALPAAFDGHKDWYGREVVYIHDGLHFMLVSYGSDGEPDRLDYPKLLGVRFEEHRKNCLWPNSDTVVSDRMVWQGCGK